LILNTDHKDSNQIIEAENNYSVNEQKSNTFSSEVKKNPIVNASEKESLRKCKF